MSSQQKRRPVRAAAAAIRVLFALLLLAGTARCDRSAGPARQDGDAVVRLGVSSGQAAAANPLNGVVQIMQNLSIESLARIGDDGHPEPQLAQSWTVSGDGKSAIVVLRSGVQFSDGTPLLAGPIADLLISTLKKTMGPAFEDVDKIVALNDSQISIQFRRPSPFLLESLEVQISKPGASDIGTGPFALAGPRAPNELRANDSYYRGRPSIDRIVVDSYPSVRAAWADLLRGHLDMLYETGVDALDSLQSSSSVNVYTFTRRYQYEVVLNTDAPALRSPRLRRALNLGIDRQAFVRDALKGQGLPSYGFVWPKHWALGGSVDTFSYNPELASRLLKAEGKQVRFTCLVPPDYERLALIVKQQLQAYGVEMLLKLTTPMDASKAIATGDFEAVLIDVISGASLFRPYRIWHTGGSMNPGHLGSPALDRVLDGIRHAASDDDYRAAVAALQQQVADDPPALFLAWSARARAVSSRFVVPPTEPGRDILASLPYWTLNGEYPVARVH
ncbi:MAG: ABC transporter substrate-binding protein [Acidobacteria bacterium]|nr:ABC transporter substrate-binding protein [Acidobacteriota bacterium]